MNKRTPYEKARHMARYGHRHWIVWTTKQGERRADRLTPDTIKQAMLAMGTQGHMSMVSPDGTPWRVGGHHAAILRANAIAGYL